MEISAKILTPRKPAFLASASVTLQQDGWAITINDVRILKNREGIVWVSMPNYAVSQGASYRYEWTVSADRELRRQIEDAVLAEYEKQPT